jgi:Xaa-Pro aminopeptidase
LSLFSDETLRRGHVVTVEPGLYEPGLGGVRIEDTIVITKRGIDNLTPLEKELRI